MITRRRARKLNPFGHQAVAIRHDAVDFRGREGIRPSGECQHGKAIFFRH
jgi:hypothetical protein